MAESVSGGLPSGRFGHVAVKVGCCILIWGGSNESGTDTINPKDIWLYNTASGVWTRKVSTGEIPPATTGACHVVVKDVLYCFAGFSLMRTNSMYKLDLRTLKWEELKIESSKPSPRDKLDCWVDGTNIIYFGGYGPYRTEENIKSGRFMYHEHYCGWNNDLLLFDTLKDNWLALPVTDSTPSPRAAHSCANLNKTEGFLFGGRVMDARLNELYHIEFNTLTWTQVKCFGDGPAGRTWHTLTAIDTNLLFLLGGYSSASRSLGDAWLYNVRDSSWKEVMSGDKAPIHWHSATLGMFPGQVIVFGGCREEGEYWDTCNDLRIIQLSPLPLKMLTLSVIQKFGAQKCGSFDVLPPELKRQCERLQQ